MLIRFGISAGELKAIVDSVYAHAGSEHLAAQGERATYSKLAVITGINRSFLPGILSTPQNEFRPRSQTQLHRAARVLSGWHDDVVFQTRTGEPAVLPISGKRKSFEQLAHRYSGGVYYPTLLAELVRVGAVKMVGTRRVRAVRRAPAPGGTNADAVLTAGEITGDLLTTLDHNLTAKPHEQLPVRALALRVDAHSLSLFRAQLAKRADGLLEMTDAFLQAHRSKQPMPAATDPRIESAGRDADEARPAEPQDLILGAGVFAICKPPTPLQSDTRSAQQSANPDPGAPKKSAPTNPRPQRTPPKTRTQKKRKARKR
jgi:hypothetical protein